jgi:hypothetical protein
MLLIWQTKCARKFLYNYNEHESEENSYMFYCAPRTKKV